MTIPTLARPLGRAASSPYVCTACASRQQIRFPSKRVRVAQRTGQRYKAGEKAEKAEAKWQETAEEIRAGRKQSLVSILRERGLINQCTEDLDNLDDLLIGRRVGAYAGFDPSAPSLHLGNLMPMMVLFWMHIHGYKTFSILGGATVKIGDPTDRLTDREDVRRVERIDQMARMHLQLKQMWKNLERFADDKYGYKRQTAWRRGIENNSVWLNKISVLEWLRLAGKRIRLGTLMSRHTVKERLEGPGMSFAEFSYPLLQAWDWWRLFESQGIQMQIGGADQYGNILTGMDVVSKIAATEIDPNNWPEKVGPEARLVGLTVPLLKTASGEKFGKSAGNAIWLSPEMLPPQEQYQYLLRTSDADVGRFLKLFTFIPIPQIEQLLVSHQEDPPKRKAQHRLAEEVMQMVHGPSVVNDVKTQMGMLFGKLRSFAHTPAGVDPSSTKMPANSCSVLQPNVTIPRSMVEATLAWIIVAAGLAATRSEAARLMAAGGAYVGGQFGSRVALEDDISYRPITSTQAGECLPFLIDDEILVLRVGKWRVKVCKVISDEEFERQGLKVPGWPELKEKLKAQREHTTPIQHPQYQHEKPIYAATRSLFQVRKSTATSGDGGKAFGAKTRDTQAPNPHTSQPDNRKARRAHLQKTAWLEAQKKERTSSS